MDINIIAKDVIECFHPGVFLEEERDIRLEEHKVTKKHIAEQLNISPKYLRQIFKGERDITIKLALKIEKEWNISAEYWLNMQLAYNLYIARKEENK